MSVGQRAFEAVQRLPSPLVPPLVNSHPSDVFVTKQDGRWWVSEPDWSAIALTRRKDAPRFLIGDRTLHGRIRSVVERYEHSDSGVVIESGDRIVDVGAFLGEFAIGAALRTPCADEVVCLEPDPRSYGALIASLEQCAADIQARQQAAWRIGGEALPMQLASDPSETSALTPDSGHVVGAIDAEAVALSSLGPIDFLKVEAEGAEPEVLAGLEEQQATKVAVNCDPERDGASPKATVIEALRGLEYDTIVSSESTVYARYGGSK